MLLNRRTFATALCLFTFLIADLAFAQALIKFSAFEIDVRPEYDRPGILVIYRIRLSPDVSLPAEVNIRIPAAAGQPNAVAEREMGGTLLNVAHERELHGDWAAITFTATLPELQLEYYDPGLVKEGRSRHFEYAWPGGYAVEALSLFVQQPADASGMRLSPQLGTGVRGSDGLLYYSADVGALDEQDAFNLVLDYQKDSDMLTVDFLEMQVETTGELTMTTPGRVSIREALPWVLGVLGVMLIASGAWWYWKLSPANSQPTQRRRRIAGYREQNEEQPDNGVYCHQCGKRATPGDRFCRVCGTRLRTV